MYGLKFSELLDNILDNMTIEIFFENDVTHPPF